jgi:N-acylneuraminate cytidylyltransferase
VSTEDTEIVNTVISFGLNIDFLRPENLSTDHTPLLPVLKYVIETYAKQGVEFDEVWLLMACSPLVEKSDLLNAAELYDSQQGTKKGILAVTEYPAPVEWAFTMNDDSSLEPLDADKQLLRSQDIETKYFDSGTFVIFPVEQILDADSKGRHSKYLGYILPKLKGIDIDNEHDWEFAEMVHVIKSRG